MNPEEQVQGNILMTLPEVELYHVHEGQHVLLEKTSLDMIYYSEMSCFVLQVGGFKYSLYKEIPVLVSRKDKEALRSYVLPSTEGYYVLRVLSMTDSPSIETFENIFSQYVTLLEEDTRAKEKTKTEAVSEMISVGGEMIKTGLIKGAEFLAKGVMKGGDYIQNKFMKDKEPSTEAIENFHKVEKNTDTIVRLSKEQLESVKEIGRVISNSIQKKWDESSIAQKAENNTVFRSVRDISKSTIYATGSILMGMLDALGIILVKGIGKTTSNLIHHRYAEGEGEENRLRTDTLEQPLLSRDQGATSPIRVNRITNAEYQKEKNVISNEPEYQEVLDTSETQLNVDATDKKLSQEAGQA